MLTSDSSKFVGTKNELKRNVKSDKNLTTNEVCQNIPRKINSSFEKKLRAN